MTDRRCRFGPRAKREMVRKGADLERLVLLRTVQWHLEDRVLAHGSRTVVFP